MKRIPLMFLVYSVLFVSVGCGPAVDLEAEKIELLRIHLADIQAHRDNEVEVIMETIPPEFIHVGDGEVTWQSRQQIRDFFTDYLAGAEYQKYEDLLVPHAEVSRDGSMGWVVSKMEIVRTSEDESGAKQTRSFIYAGIMTYEKVDGKWMKVANVSTFAP